MKRTREELRTWLVALIAELVGVAPESIDVSAPFDRYGVDSAAAVGVTGELESYLERQLEPTLLYDFPTIQALVDHLADD